MKKYIILLVSTLVIIIILGNLPINTNTIETIAQTTEIYDTSETSDYYIAKSYNNKIAIFTPDEILPILVTEINIKTLPILDQTRLEIGIILDENYPLNKFIEDFSN